MKPVYVLVGGVCTYYRQPQEIIIVLDLVQAWMF